MPKKKDEKPEVQPEQKVEEMTKDIVKYEKKYVSLEVGSEEDYAKGNTVLVELKGRLKRIESLEEGFNNPHQEIRRIALTAMQDNTALLAVPKSRYEKVYAVIKSGMEVFRLAENKRVAQEEADARAEQKKQEEEAAEAAKEAEEKGEEVAPAPMPAPLPTVAKVAKTQATEAGSSTAKNVIKFEIEDVLVLPKKYRDMILEDSLKRGHANTVIDKFVKAEGLKFKAKGVRVFEAVDISVKTK